MKRTHLMLGAAMAVFLSTPALSAVTLVPSQGQLDNHINGDDYDDGDDNTVYGTSETGGEVKFTANTAIDITNGFASISPVDGDFFWLIVNPVEAFTQLDFTLQFLDGTDFTVDYTLIGGGTGSLGPISQNSDKAFDYLLSGNNGEVFDFIKITSLGSEIKMQKHNSLELASPGAVPEPGTWAMMLFGFGGVGLALRRRRRTGTLMLQAA